MPDLGVSRLALLPLLLAVVLAAQAYYNPSVPRNDVLWNGAPAPQQALAVYPYAIGADLGCAASGGSLPSAWTFEVLAYHLPMPIYYYYTVGSDGWQGSPFFITFEYNGLSIIRYWDNRGVEYRYGIQAVGWKHVLISWDGSTLRYWVNGQLVYSTGITNPRTSFTNIKLWLGGTSDKNRISPLIIAWIKLWSGAVTSQTQADQLARGVAPPGFSLVAGMDYTQWPPRALAGTWDCNGKLFGVPVTRVFGAYVDTAWSGPYAPGRLFGFGFFGSAEIAYAHTP
ncbi:MAG: LamG-like jellyroll fold domain-containing protein, partial [Pyrobaculum sp.]